MASFKPSIHPCSPAGPQSPVENRLIPLTGNQPSSGRLIWVVKETLAPEEGTQKMTGLNSLTNFYCPQISSPVSHEINLSPHQINDHLFKNERVDEAKSVQRAPPSLGCISGTLPSRTSPNPSQPCISPANSPDRSPAQRVENNQGLSLLLKNCKDNQAGGKKL